MENPEENNVPHGQSKDPIQDQDSKEDTKPPTESAPVKPSCGVQPQSQSPLVYVRRRVEVDILTNKAKEAAAETTAVVVVAQSPPQGPPTSHTNNTNRLEWEERYHHLQMLLNKLNESDQSNHLQMLWSLPSAELSKHAVELEKRSIQLSLEEAREMQRVAALNLLGRSVNSLKSTSNDGEDGGKVNQSAARISSLQ